jgi:hypothetical protein
LKTDVIKKRNRNNPAAITSNPSHLAVVAAKQPKPRPTTFVQNAVPGGSIPKRASISTSPNNSASSNTTPIKPLSVNPAPRPVAFAEHRGINGPQALNKRQRRSISGERSLLNMQAAIAPQPSQQFAVGSAPTLSALSGMSQQSGNIDNQSMPPTMGSSAPFGSEMTPERMQQLLYMHHQQQRQQQQQQQQQNSGSGW